MRTDVAAELEHDLLAVAEPELPGVTAPPDPCDVDGNSPTERGEASTGQRLAPDSEDVCECRASFEADDAARVEGPDGRAAVGRDDTAELQTGPAQPDSRGNHDHAAPCEELYVDAATRVQWGFPAGKPGGRRPGGRRVAWPLADRGRHRVGERERRRQQRRNHRLHGTRLAVLLLLAATVTGASGAAPARADGDPASDYLITQKVFLPYDAKIPKAQQSALIGAVESANSGGYPVKVALIWTSYDLGSVPELFKNPRYYARFLDTEDSYWFKKTTRLIVVMPNGLGFAQWKHSPSAGYKALAGIKVKPTPAGMAAAATTAVTKLASAAGVKVSTGGSKTAHYEVSRNNQDRIEIVVAVVAALLLGAAARFLIRRRAARSALR